MPEKTRTIEAVHVTCEIINLLQEQETAGITEIANEIGRSKSSVHAYLSTLVDEKYIVKKDHKYSLSLRYLELGQHLRNKIGNYNGIYSETNELSDVTNEVAQFATIAQDNLVYIHEYPIEFGNEETPSIGNRGSFHSTSFGKAILSCLKRDRVLEIIGPGPLTRKTDHTITDIDTLFKDLRETRERGYAIDDEESDFRLRSIAAPVILDQGIIIGAIGITGPASRMSIERIKRELEDRVKRTANNIRVNIQSTDTEYPPIGTDRGILSDFQSGTTTKYSQNRPVPEPDEQLHETEYSDIIKSEWCRIQPVHSEKALGIHAGSISDGSQLQQHSWQDNDMQKFELTKLPNGAYRIDAAHSGKPIEVENASTSTGATIQQNSWTNEDNQKWRIERLGETDTFRIVNVNSGKVIDVVGESKEDGTSVVQWSWTGGRNQQFRISVSHTAD